MSLTITPHPDGGTVINQQRFGCYPTLHHFGPEETAQLREYFRAHEPTITTVVEPMKFNPNDNSRQH